MAGVTAIAQDQLAFGLVLALGGPLYVLLTAFSAVIEKEASPHHTAVTAVDILLITAVVWVTGGVHSEYYLLYYLPVLTAALRLNTRDGITACALSGLLYVFVALDPQHHPAMLTSPLARVFAVCVSAAVLVIFLSLLKREVRFCNDLSETLHTSLGRVAAIYGVAHAGNIRAGLAPLLSILLDHTARITRAANGWILLPSPDGRLKPMASLSSPPSEADKTIEFPRPPADRAASEGASILLPPPEQTPPAGPAEDRSFMYVPLKTPADTIGVAVLASRAGRKFTRTNVEFVEAICAEAALAVENARLRAELRRLAVTDHLTGLPTRREIERRLLAELARARRYQRPLALLMIDVDNLKSVNDRFGHAAGDDLLRVLGELLESRVRSTDAVGRIGGDEFIVVLTETDTNQAKVLADCLIRAFPQRIADGPTLPHSPSLDSAGLSIGVAATSRGTNTAKQLIARADAAMYDAKRAGKGRSHIAKETSELPAPAEPQPVTS